MTNDLKQRKQKNLKRMHDHMERQNNSPKTKKKFTGFYIQANTLFSQTVVDILFSFANSGETAKPEPISVQLFDADTALVSDYSYPIAKSSNWIAVIGYLHDHATIT